jgi:hypothetical protein
LQLGFDGWVISQISEPLELERVLKMLGNHFHGLTPSHTLPNFICLPENSFKDYGCKPKPRAHFNSMNFFPMFTMDRRKSDLAGIVAASSICPRHLSVTESAFAPA